MAFQHAKLLPLFRATGVPSARLPDQSADAEIKDKGTDYNERQTQALYASKDADPTPREAP
jgi:hypothetical protein